VKTHTTNLRCSHAHVCHWKAVGFVRIISNVLLVVLQSPEGAHSRWFRRKTKLNRQNQL